MSDLPVILVHNTQESGETSEIQEKKKLGKNVSINPKSVGTVKIKRNGKPSRRWLAKQLEVLKLQNQDLMKTLQTKGENELRLIEIKARLENELQHYRSSVADRPTQKLRMTVLTQDLFILKNLVVKLNKELQRYQDKYGSLANSDEGASGQHTNIRTKWIDGELTLLAPLLVAYDENIKEKEELVKDATEKLKAIGNDCKELVKENEELRSAIKESCEKGDVNYADWQTVQRENLMFKEQNQLLLRQAKLNQSKLQQLKESFQIKLNEIILERDDAVDRLHQTKTELSMLKGRFSIMAEEFDRLKAEDSGKIPHSVHTAYITECRRLFEELKERYEQDREILMRKIAESSTERTDYENEISKLNSERENAKGKLSLLSEEIRSLRENFQKMTKENSDLRTQLNSAVDFSKQLITQEEKLLKELQLRTEEANLGSKLAGRVENLKRNMKNVEIDTIQQMQAIDKDLEKQVKCVGKIKESFTSEITRLRNLLDKRTFQKPKLRWEEDVEDSLDDSV
ncbi:centrosomal protein 89kDa isoform X3 [Rhodnius prolixus]|uniref:centrosomal protein 89kDa isoform X3 n=1 Tax=Rhodnius prolixus TaxID=13249 RepID=UPI003D18B5FC